MSLVSGPGRGGSNQLPEELILAVDQHIKYIQSLDTVSTAPSSSQVEHTLILNSAKMSWSTG